MTQSITDWIFRDPGLRRFGFDEAVLSSDGVILFDGECRFCNDVVCALLRICENLNIWVCSTRSHHGYEVAKLIGSDPAATFGFITKSAIYVGVDAYVAILSLSSKSRTISRILDTIPRGISMAVYKWVARNRQLVSRIWKIRKAYPIPSERFVPGGYQPL